MSTRLNVLLRMERGLDRTIRDGASMIVPYEVRYMLTTTLEHACDLRASMAIEKAKLTSKEDIEQ